MNFKCQNVSLKVAQKVLIENLNIEFPRRGLVGVIGLNGSGKSTLLRAMAGLQSFEGQMLYLDKKWPLDSPTENAQKCSWLSSENLQGQSVAIKGFDFVALGRAPWSAWNGRLSESDREQVEFALRFWDVEKWAHQDIQNMSTGEFQRLNLARNRVQGTPLQLFDEPTAPFDPVRKEEFYQKLKDSNKESEVLSVVVEHDLPFIFQHADMILAMCPNGKWLFDQPDVIRSEAILKKIFSENGQDLPEFWVKNCQYK
jgi:ABC-type cobalamin/Fe3+-siderophores transport system ATPase subunit